MRETGRLRFSVRVPAMGWINNVRLVKGLSRMVKTGVGETLHAVLEPYAGKARTYGSSGAAFPQGDAAAQ